MMSIQPIALSMGEPAGIGPEICVKTWLARKQHDLAPFYLIGDPKVFVKAAEAIGEKVAFAAIFHAQECTDLPADYCPVLAKHLPEENRPGEGKIGNGATVLDCIRQGIVDCLSGDAAALVTAPINKAVLAAGGFPHPGHTEFVAELSGGAKPVMMLAGPDLRVIPITIHLSLKQAILTLSTELIVETARIAAHALRQDFGLAEPRLAFAGLNPHAGEGGMLGYEDQEIILPAVEQLRAEGFKVTGPLPADTMFHPPARAQYDVALCMYHDQANIPIKTIAFDEGVNCTIGLPVVRTSPDHGTAFDIAGTGAASATSMISATRLAAEIAKHRQHD